LTTPCKCCDNIVLVLWQCCVCFVNGIGCIVILSLQHKLGLLPGERSVCMPSVKRTGLISRLCYTHTHKLCTHTHTHKLCTHTYTHSQHRDKVFIASVSHLYYRGLTPAYDGDEFSLIQDRYNALLQEAEQAANEPLVNDQQSQKKGNRGGNPGKRKARVQPVGVFGSHPSGDKSATPSDSRRVVNASRRHSRGRGRAEVGTSSSVPTTTVVFEQQVNCSEWLHNVVIML